MRLIKGFTNPNTDHYKIPPKQPKKKYEQPNLLIPVIFGGILLFLFWIKKCQ